MTPPSPTAALVGGRGLSPLQWWDIPQVVALEAELFATDSPWTAAMFWAELAAGHHYVAYRDMAEKIVGYAGLAHYGDSADVQTIGVAPTAQGQGIGRLLLADLLQAAGHVRVLLEVRVDNIPAINLYRQYGFVEVGVRRRYYQPSDTDALTMVRDEQVENI